MEEKKKEQLEKELKEMIRNNRKASLAAALLEEQATRNENDKYLRGVLAKREEKDNRIPFWMWCLLWCLIGMMLEMSITTTSGALAPSILALFKG